MLNDHSVFYLFSNENESFGYEGTGDKFLRTYNLSGDDKAEDGTRKDFFNPKSKSSLDRLHASLVKASESRAKGSALFNALKYFRKSFRTLSKNGGRLYQPSLVSDEFYCGGGIGEVEDGRENYQYFGD